MKFGGLRGSSEIHLINSISSLSRLYLRVYLNASTKIVAHDKITKGKIVHDVETGTRILIPIIKKYKPSRIYACDLSERMLQQLRKITLA